MMSIDHSTVYRSAVFACVGWRHDDTIEVGLVATIRSRRSAMARIFRSIAVRGLAALLVIAFADAPSEARIIVQPEPRKFKFEIDPKTPVKELVPAAPATPATPLPYVNDDLRKVPEVAFGDPELRKKDVRDFEEAAAYQIAKINLLSRDDPDAFVKALRAHRPDLGGLPFLMGKDCRTEAKSAQVFAETVAIVRQQLQTIALRDPEAASVPNAAYTEKLIWGDFPQLLAAKGDSKSKRSQATAGELDQAAVMALAQMMPLKPALWRALYARHLGTIPDRKATETLARLALFAPEDSVRQAALAGMKGRPADHYRAILLDGFRYPWPTVPGRAADAVVALARKEMLGDLVAVLDSPDPRAPHKQQVDGKEATVVREVVRINHHRNCLLCHAPANTSDVPKEVLTAPVTLLQERIQIGYGPSGQSPDTFVRIDVTYLRQDFSQAEGPKRFDYLVRTRVVTAEEAADCAKQIASLGTPPSHAAAQRALRELTGRQPANPTAQAWRDILKESDSSPR
jgi:hypothetical protein